MKRDSFVMYRSFIVAMSVLSPKEFKETMMALASYGLDGVAPDHLGKVPGIILAMAQPQIDKNNEKYEYGKKGGRPKKAVVTEEETKGSEKVKDGKAKVSKSKTTGKESRNGSKANENDSVKGNASVNDYESEKANDNEDANGEDTPWTGEGEPEVRSQEVVDMYNEICLSLPKVTVMNDSRRKAIKTITDRYSLADVQQVFLKAEKSDFLKGGGDRNFVASFDWLMKDKNFVKTLEGNYDNRGREPPEVMIDWSRV